MFLTSPLKLKKNSKRKRGTMSLIVDSEASPNAQSKLCSPLPRDAYIDRPACGVVTSKHEGVS